MNLKSIMNAHKGWGYLMFSRCRQLSGEQREGRGWFRKPCCSCDKCSRSRLWFPQSASKPQSEAEIGWVIGSAQPQHRGERSSTTVLSHFIQMSWSKTEYHTLFLSQCGVFHFDQNYSCIIDRWEWVLADVKTGEITQEQHLQDWVNIATQIQSAFISQFIFP